MAMAFLSVGLDDTDSPRGMCTTYLAAVLADKFAAAGVRLNGLPRLIRLNPNCPWKTRGNCALSLTLEINDGQEITVMEITKSTIEELAEIHDDETNPGAVFVKGIPDAHLQEFGRRAVTNLIELDEARRLAEARNIKTLLFKKGRGLVGALAAASYQFGNEATYELIAYRTQQFRGRKRLVDFDSVLEMDRLTYPATFDNIDYSTREVRITPHTPCPVLYGIRGVTPEAVFRAFNIVRAGELIERWTVFETNQATDQHYIQCDIASVRPYTTVRLVGVVEEPPKIEPGGHVFFWLRDHTGKTRCAAYEPTRGFRSLISKLIVGDVIEVYGGVKPKPPLPLTVNLEKIRIINLAPKVKRHPPLCPNCGNSMKSKGLMAGFRCKNCDKKLPPSAAILLQVDRKLEPSFYEVPPRSRRHLSKPLALARIY